MTSQLCAQRAEVLASRVVIDAARRNPEVFHRVTLFDMAALTQTFQLLMEWKQQPVECEGWDKTEFSLKVKV